MTPDERSMNLANVFQNQAKVHRAEAWREAEEEANEVFSRVENILVKELPRVADMMGGVVRGLEQRLEAAHAEIGRLRAETEEEIAHTRAETDGEILRIRAEAQTQMDALRQENAQLAAKVAAIEELKRSLARI